MDGFVDQIFNYFVERHIVLKEDWLSATLRFLNERYPNLSNSHRIFDLVFEQWKYSDLAESSYPILHSLNPDAIKSSLAHPMVLQILSVLDIGSSFHSQFRKLTYEFVDNSGFAALPEQEQNGDDFTEAKPRRMISLEVSDGEQTMKAVEQFSIPRLSLLVKPGCKILFYPPMEFRRGIFMMKPGNCQLIGGDVEKMMETGRPVEVMARLLNLPIPARRPRATTSTTTQAPKPQPPPPLWTSPTRQNAHPPLRPGRIQLPTPLSPTYSNASTRRVTSSVDTTASIQRHSTDGSRDSNYALNRSLIQPKLDRSILNADDFEELPDEAQSLGADDDLHVDESEEDIDMNRMNISRTRVLHEIQSESTTSTSNKTNRKRSSTHYVEEEKSPHHHTVRLNSGTEGSSSRTTPISPPPCVARNDATNSGPSIKRDDSLYDPRNRSNIVKGSKSSTSGLMGFLQNRQISSAASTASAPPAKKVDQKKSSSSNSVFNPNKVKQEKIEVIDLDDSDEDIKPKVDKSLLRTPCVVEKQKTKIESQDEQIVRPQCPLVSAWEALNVCFIADVVRQTRFAVGSTKRNIQASCKDIQESLRIVDDVWTMKVLLHDESAELPCLIDNDTLTSLIGLNCEEAMAIKTSTDLARRKDGTRRIAALEDQLKRLDLVFEVEFFSGSRATSIVRNVRTISQMLEPGA